MTDLEILMRLGVALAIGLLVGLERGWQQREVPEGQRAAGLRTFAISGLLGGVAGALAHGLDNLPFLGMAFLGFTGAFTMFHWMESREEGRNSVTGVVSGLLVFLLGAYAVLGEVRVAVAAGVAATLLLLLRDQLHGWLKRLKWVEIRAVLILAVMSFLALPVLPNRPLDPWGVLNPAEIWFLAILIAAISFGGYVAVRLFGEKAGILVAATAGGLASSTATTLTLSRLARQQEGGTGLLAAGVLIAGMVMMGRVVLVAGILNRSLLLPLAGPAGAMLVVLGLAVGLLMWRGDKEGGLPGGKQDGEEDKEGNGLTLSNPLELATALKLAAFIAIVLIGAELLRRFVGDAGLLLGAAVSGIADVDAITIAMARQGGGPVEGAAFHLPTAAILLAVAVNTMSKAVMAGSVGGGRLGLYVGLPSLLAVLAGGAAWWLLAFQVQAAG
ncbi:MgtC/SapB family protein [Niveispirillum sp. KHB5.9]|uniref:MgtC/SapB family protein n=1 Tax=Niveispirillum sp. KHB5.9 TaxID=3400269 RepID=UPI003A8A4CD1